MTEPYRPCPLGQNADVDFLVAADDRTGAFESAAALADRGAGPVAVCAWPAPVPDRGTAVVVDLATRHLSPDDARARVSRLPAASRSAHKIDSTLRGNWPEELAARNVTSPVLLIPALPEMGRTCVDGVVLEHGRPVDEGSAGSDVRRRVTTSRPVDALRSAGTADVDTARDVDDVVAWLGDPHGIRVADASAPDTITALVGAWSLGPADVVLAGTSTVIGAAAPYVTDPVPSPPIPEIDAPILVACGSVHPSARAQLVHAEQRGLTIAALADDITVRALGTSESLALVTEIPVGDVNEPLAVAAATSLARGVDHLRREVRLGALIVVGGDTAAAVLGSAAVTVHGSVLPGTALATVDGFEMPVITRSGGFGGESALLDLIRTVIDR